MGEPESKLLLDEMEAIKKLLVLQLLATGYKQKDIAATLGISDATLSRMLPKKMARDFPKGDLAQGYQ